MAMPNPAANAAPEEMVKQFREFLVTYNKVTEMCFDACIHNFTSRKLAENEQSCTGNCMDKYLKMTQRISLRFAEHQVSMNEGQLGPMQQKSKKT